jgi:hypothetical protein
MTKIIVAFHNFVIAPKNEVYLKSALPILFKFNILLQIIAFAYCLRATACISI